MSPQLAQPAHQARPGAGACLFVVASQAPYRGRAALPYCSLRLPCRGALTPYRRHSATRPCALCRARRALRALPRAPARRAVRDAGLHGCNREHRAARQCRVAAPQQPCRSAPAAVSQHPSGCVAGPATRRLLVVSKGGGERGRPPPPYRRKEGPIFYLFFN